MTRASIIVLLLAFAGASVAGAASRWVAHRLPDAANVGDPTAPASIAPVGAGWLVGIPGRAAGSAVLVDADGRLVATLVPSASSREFGRVVRASGGSLVVGAPDVDAVYVFDARSHALATTLRDPSTGGEPNEFGRALAIDGDAFVVGAPFDDRDGHDAGAAHVFDRTTYRLRHRLASGAAVAGARFGTAVAIAGDTVIVGASAEGGVAGSGAVYAFSARTGELLWSRTAPDAARDRLFGYAVDVAGRWVVVGAPCRDGTPVPGAAVVYDRASGDLVHVLAATKPERCDFFGGAVAVAGGTIAVGARLAGASNGGAVHVFSAATGGARARFTGTGGERGLGWSVAIAGGSLVAGSAGDDGKVHVFARAND
jgi:outer membrane protein assembly factor BamB